jgi:undecaprenyl-phosphate 4-deoxy-4-formamido-L-arabinose transferase
MEMTFTKSSKNNDPAIMFSVIVPTHNSGNRLDSLIKQLSAEQTLKGKSYEVLIVDDESTDDTWTTVQRLSKQCLSVRGLRLAVNVGQHLATLAGLRDARGETCVTMDDDLRHPPSAIMSLLGECTTFGGEFEIVNARLRASASPTWRRLASAFMRWIFGAILGARSAKGYSSFRALESNVVKRLDGFKGPNFALDIPLQWVSQRIGFVEVDCGDFQTSRYSLRKLGGYAILTSIGYSKRPLYAAVTVGAALSTLSAIGIVAIIISTLIRGSAPPGFFTFSVALLSLGAVQVLVTGTLSIYFASIFDRILGRDFAHVAERT